VVEQVATRKLSTEGSKLPFFHVGCQPSYDVIYGVLRPAAW